MSRNPTWHREYDRGTMDLSPPLHKIRILLLVLLFTKCYSQEKPFFNTTMYAKNITHRQNFCPLHRNVTLGLVSRKDALKGMNLHTALYDYQLNEYDEINPTNPTIGIRIMDALAQRAEFNYRNTYGVIKLPNKTDGEDYDDQLDWLLNVYDITADYFMNTVERKSRGVIYPASGWFDASTIMVRKKDIDNDEDFTLWSFSDPFTPGVWAMVLLTIFGSSLFYFALDYLDSVRLGKDLNYSFTSTIFAAANSFMGHIEFKPKSIATKLVVLSTAFIFCLFISAYTANLASFLVVKNSGGIEIQDLNDVIKNDLRICVSAGTSTEDIVENLTYSNYYTVTKSPLELQAVQNGTCDVALVPADEFRTKKTQKKINPDCALDWVGRTVLQSESGFVMGDDSEYCGSLIRDILDIHFLEMVNDGSFEKIWEDYTELTDDAECDSVENERNDAESNSLNVKNMAGIIVFHCFMLSAALVCSLVTLYNYPAYIMNEENNKENTSKVDEDVNKEIGKEVKKEANGDVNEDEDVAKNKAYRLSMEAEMKAMEERIIAQVTRIQTDIDEKMGEGDSASVKSFWK